MDPEVSISRYSGVLIDILENQESVGIGYTRNRIHNEGLTPGSGAGC
jgi:hypothetical protein